MVTHITTVQQRAIDWLEDGYEIVVSEQNIHLLVHPETGQSRGIRPQTVRALLSRDVIRLKYQGVKEAVFELV